MNGTDVNVVLALVVILTGAMALAVWVSPKALHWAIARLYARACALEAARKIYTEAYGEAILRASGQREI